MKGFKNFDENMEKIVCIKNALRIKLLFFSFMDPKANYLTLQMYIMC